MEVHSPFKPLAAPDVDIYTTFDAIFKTKPDDVALVACSSGDILTYDDVRRHVELVAGRLLQDGFRKGDRLALCCTNCADYVIFMAATVRLGGTIVGINHILTEVDIQKQLGMVKARFVFTGLSIAPKIHTLLDTSDIRVYVRHHPTSVSNCVSVESIYHCQPDQYPSLPALSDLQIDPRRDPAVILFSSGTTGFPKPVVLSHYSFLCTSYNLAHPDVLMMRGSQIIYQPMCHIFGMSLASLCLTFGVTTIIMNKFNLDEYIRLASHHNVRYIHTVPPVAVQLAKTDVLTRHSTGHIEAVCMGAGPVGEHTERQVLQRLRPGARFRQVYGMTETAGIITLTPAAHHPLSAVPPGSVGLLAPNTSAKVVDLTSGVTLGPGQEGEILVKGPQIMLGYEGRPHATREMIDQQNWLHTGDIGKFDENGFCYVTDRLKELIKYKGYQVAPVELESYILAHPDVSDAGVFSVSDEVNGELPRAWVVRKPNSRLTESQLQSFVNDQVAAFKKLRGGIKFVEIIPRSASGKVLRRVMKNADNKSSKL